MINSRIAPPVGEKAFTLECSYLRGILRSYRAYDRMETSEKRAFLWMLGEWRVHGQRVANFRVPPRLDQPYRVVADDITMLFADILAEKAGVKPTIALEPRVLRLSGWIHTLEAVEEMPNDWY